MKRSKAILYASQYHTYDHINDHFGRNWVTCIASAQLVRLLAKRDWKLDNVSLSPDDKLRLADGIQLWLLCLQDCLDRESIGSYPRKALISWAFRLARYDLKAVIKQLKLALGILREDNASNGIISYTEWKHFYKALGLDPVMLGPIFELLKHFHNVQNEGAFLSCNDAIQFILRLTLSDISQVEEELIQDYIDTEHELAQKTYNPVLVDLLNKKAKEWLSDLDESEFHPAHSSGATASVRRADGYEMKYRDMPSSYGPLAITDGSVIPSGDQVCVLGIVPKGIDKKRLISKETTVVQYHQQGVFRMLDAHFNKHPWMNIHLHHSEYSADLCQNASDSEWRIKQHDARYPGLVEETTWEERLVLSHNHGTADLSSASDLHSYTVVKGIYSGTPLEPYIFNFRSDMVWIDDGGRSTIIGLEKFAPMGSACCFPVMCLTLSMVLDLARDLCRSHQLYLVYGDDIEASEDIWDIVLWMLPQLGFKVNLEKSFDPYQAFKESCGMESWFGHDVRPIRIPRRYDALSILSSSPAALSALIDFANACEDRLPSVWAQLINKITRHYGDVGFGYTGGLSAKACQGVIKRKLRYNFRLQRLEVRALVAKTTEYDHYQSTRLLKDLASLMRDSNAKVNFSDDDKDSVSTSKQRHKLSALAKQVLAFCDADEGREDNESEFIRYQHCLQQMSSTHRQRLLYPEDRITAKVGPAVTTLEWVWLPDDGSLYSTQV